MSKADLKNRKGKKQEMEQTKPSQFPKIFIAGDSTAASYSGERYPMMGWGQVIEYYLHGVCIVNLAQCGRSSKSFIDEGWLAVIEREIQPGDYLLIQFGHNDEKSQDPSRYTQPQTTYPEYLTKYISLAKEHRAYPVLITPVARRTFEGGELCDSHGDYPQAMRDLAKREGVPCIDLTALSMNLLTELGEDASKALFTKVQPGDFPGYPEGHDDNTHFCQKGALEIASLIGAEMKRLFPGAF